MGIPSLGRLAENKSHLATWLGITLYVIVSAIYLGFGQVNVDEGWYLYASKLVFQGALPYRDFAYTQTPLLPYVYGVVQIIDPGVLTGRLTSILLSIGTLGMSVIIARRYAGAWASAITALLLASFTFCVYNISIVKTYALLSFFFAATLFVLSSHGGTTWKYLLAGMYALLAALVRVTGVFFAAPILVYILFTAPRKARLFVLLETAAVSLLGGIFLIADWPAASWGLFSSHLGHWGSSPISDRVKDILTLRLPEVAQSFGPALVLGAAALYFMLRLRTAKSWQRNPAPLFAVSGSLVLFAASHFPNGLWANEYLVPAAVAMTPVIAIGLTRLYFETPSASRSFIQGALFAVVLLLPLGESTQHTDLTGGMLPLAEADQIASFVRENSSPGDKVLALEALDVVVDANRSVLPGMTLAQFSLQNVDRATAQQLHVVNADMVAQAIKEKAARVIILTDADLVNLVAASSSEPEAAPIALEQNYYQALAMELFGEYARNLHVYLSR